MSFLPETFDWFESITLTADWWGIIGLVAVIAIAVTSYFLFRHFNRLGSLIAKTVLLAFFTFRVVLMVQYAKETGNILDIVPWQLSSLCFLLLPISVLLNLPRCIKTQIAFASFLTGAITLIGMAVSPLTFEELGATAVLEALLSHSILTVTPILLLVTDEIRFTLKGGLTATVILFCLMIGWGYLANLVLYPGHNIVYLETSVLPFSITGIPAIDYAILFFPSAVLFYFFMFFFHKHHDRYRAKRNARLARENVLLKENRRAKRIMRTEARKRRKEERRAAKVKDRAFD